MSSAPVANINAIKAARNLLIHISRTDAPEQRYLDAARVPRKLRPQSFGDWSIKRVTLTGLADLLYAGSGTMTVLRRAIRDPERLKQIIARWETLGRLNVADAFTEVVMEDSRTELCRHLPIFRHARGTVLINGLGLGCVVRGLLVKREVSHIDVVELDPGILRVVGPEFSGNPRVTLHAGDALTYPWPEHAQWDFGWHDIVANPSQPHLQILHAQLMERFYGRIGRQGAWLFPRFLRRFCKGTPWLWS